ncbi:putative efflux domain protein, partial [Vibrio parahaemolyticus V-223/04]
MKKFILTPVVLAL